MQSKETSSADVTSVGVVIIGRNEGERLLSCIRSVLPQSNEVVYVDSGSTDNSVADAQTLGCSVVELDMSIPFNAARGRNEGAQYLLAHHPELTFIQFVDGDCELVEGWMAQALAKMASDETIAIVCGRRRERFPSASIFNSLCDLEWDTPIGEANACGGDSLVRVKAFQAVSGFDTRFAAGEEPEMCFRMRALGWRIWRLDAEMTLHDAAMTRFQQWWTRSVRSGSAYAQSAWVHGHASAERYCVRESVSIWLWALVIPAIALLLAPFTLGASLLLFGLYPVLGWRIFRWRRSIGDNKPLARRYALYTIIGKWAQLVGQIRFLSRRESQLIEYKGTA